MLIGVGVGIATYRQTTIAGLATTTTASFLTIPSLALLDILLGPFGLATTPVMIALVLEKVFAPIAKD